LSKSAFAVLDTRTHSMAPCCSCSFYNHVTLTKTGEGVVVLNEAPYVGTLMLKRGKRHT